MRGEIMRQKSILSQISPLINSQGKSKLFEFFKIFYKFDSFNFISGDLFYLKCVKGDLFYLK